MQLKNNGTMTDKCVEDSNTDYLMPGSNIRSGENGECHENPYWKYLAYGER
jgi:hypothetical protein